MTWKFLFATLAISAEHVQADYDMTFPPSVLGGRPQQYTIGTNYWIDSAVRVCSEGDGANTEQTDTNDLTVGSDYGGHASLPHTGKPVGVLIQDSQMDGYVSPPNGGQATGTAHTVLQIPAGSLTYPISINFPEAAQKIIWTYNIQTTHCGGLNGTSTVNYTLRMKKNMTRKEDSL